VADRIREYEALGISKFIFSGYPHLEESYRFAELVFPLLGLDARDASNDRLKSPSLSGPFGEVIANGIVPKVAQG